MAMNEWIIPPAVNGMPATGNKTGTPISGITLPTNGGNIWEGLNGNGANGTNGTNGTKGTKGSNGNKIGGVLGALAGDQGNVIKGPQGALLDAINGLKKPKGGGGSAGLSEERQKLKEQYANNIAAAYAAMNQPGQAAWNDTWQPRIDAMYGDRYRDYESRYQPQMDGLMDRLLNRGDFQYNWSDDPLYRQYAARYAQQARQGMQDTMGQAAALTGGYGSSYATAAGQQAYANQMAGLNDQAMNLYAMAKDRWDTQGEEMRSNLSALTGLEDRNRAMYESDRGSYYDRNDADLANLQNSQQMAYNMYLNQLNQEEAARQRAWDQYQYWNNLYEQNYLK